MNKKELVKAISEKSNLRKRQGARVVDALIDLVGEELKQGNCLKILGMGTFEVRDRKEREFVNPRTKQSSTLQSKKAPAFYASTTLKKKLKDRTDSAKRQ